MAGHEHESGQNVMGWNMLETCCVSVLWEKEYNKGLVIKKWKGRGDENKVVSSMFSPPLPWLEKERKEEIGSSWPKKKW